MGYFVIEAIFPYSIDESFYQAHIVQTFRRQKSLIVSLAYIYSRVILFACVHKVYSDIIWNALQLF